MFVGFAKLDLPFVFPVLIVDSSAVPQDSTTTPLFRVYGNAGLMTAGTGTLTAKESGSLTDATNASPIVITSTNHGLSTGMRVTITGVLVNTAANGTFTITVTDANHFSLNGSTGNGVYGGGGTWKTTGYYACSITPTEGNTYASGEYYDVLIIGTVGGNTVEYAFRFGVL